MSRNNSDNEHFVKIVLSAHCMFEGQEAKRLNVRLNSTAKNKSNCEHEKLPLADLQKKVIRLPRELKTANLMSDSTRKMKSILMQHTTFWVVQL